MHHPMRRFTHIDIDLSTQQPAISTTPMAALHIRELVSPTSDINETLGICLIGAFIAAM